MSTALTADSAPPLVLEPTPCPGCGAVDATHFTWAWDDLTGKPGRFAFVRCRGCALVYQSPRVPLQEIRAWYDEEYISHRRRSDLGPLTGLYTRALDGHDRRKAALVERFVQLGPRSQVLDVGCGAGTFLRRIQRTTGASVTGVDFKRELAQAPSIAGAEGSPGIDLRVGLFYEQELPEARYDLITMWHFLEHCYDPLRSLREARRVLVPGSGRVVIEVPRLDSVSFRLYRERWPGLQAPQHTVLLDKQHLLAFVREAGLEVLEYLPYGAFPAWFYLFAGAAFKLLRGRGLDLRRAMFPYFAGQLLLSPLLLFERRLNLAMHTVVCRSA